jgi:hypothetical protein
MKTRLRPIPNDRLGSEAKSSVEESSRSRYSIARVTQVIVMFLLGVSTEVIQNPIAHRGKRLRTSSISAQVHRRLGRRLGQTRRHVAHVRYVIGLCVIGRLLHKILF